MAEQDWKTTLLSKLPEILGPIVTILGIAIALLGVTRGITHNDWLPIPDATSRWAAVALGVAIAIFGRFSLKPVKGAPKGQECGFRFDSPKNGDLFDRADVHGSFGKAPPEGYAVWIFRNYPDQGFLPLRKCRVSAEDGTWEAAECDLGGAAPGDKRSFSVNLIGPDGGALLAYMEAVLPRYRELRDGWQKCSGKTDIPYLPLMYKRTQDMVECCRVDVRRR